MTYNRNKMNKAKQNNRTMLCRYCSISHRAPDSAGAGRAKGEESLRLIWLLCSRGAESARRQSAEGIKQISRVTCRMKSETQSLRAALHRDERGEEARGEEEKTLKSSLLPCKISFVPLSKVASGSGEKETRRKKKKIHQRATTSSDERRERRAFSCSPNAKRNEGPVHECSARVCELRVRVYTRCRYVRFESIDKYNKSNAEVKRREEKNIREYLSRTTAIFIAYIFRSLLFLPRELAATDVLVITTFLCIYLIMRRIKTEKRNDSTVCSPWQREMKIKHTHEPCFRTA